VTDFRGDNKAPAAKPADGAQPDAPKSDTAAPPPASAAKSDAAPAASPAPAPAAAPAAPKSESK
jgi:hypothetical protein